MKSLVALTGFSLLAVDPAAAQDEELDVAPIIEGRQSNLRDLGAALKAINDELKKGQPSLPLIRQYAKQIDDLAKQQGFWFPPGSGPESDIETDAKAEIWTKGKEFSAAQAAMTLQAAKLVQVAAGADVTALKAQHLALGKTCKQCHDSFREE